MASASGGGSGSGAGPGGRRGKALTPDRAWAYLLDLLGRRMYTTAELASRLRRRGVDEAEAERLVARLVELQLVDDATYADQYVSSRSAVQGRLALRRSLAHKGVAPETIEERLGQLTEADQLASATALLAKHAWRYRPQPGSPQAAVLGARARAFAFLARRGFSVDAVQGALEALGWYADDA